MGQLNPLEVSSLVWYRGQIVDRDSVSPSVACQTLHLGVGVFDGMMAYLGNGAYHVYRMDEHLNRFVLNARSLGLEIEHSKQELRAGVLELLDRWEHTDWYVRPIAYLEHPEINVVRGEPQAVISILGVVAPQPEDRALRCTVVEVERVSATAVPVSWKTCGSYVNSFLARRSAHSRGFDDGVFLDRKGFVSEASAANIFFVTVDGDLVTPALEHDVFPGITRESVIDIAADLGVAVDQRAVHPDEIGSFEAAFLCSTLMEIRPLSCLEAASYNPEHPVVLSIRKRFQERTRGGAIMR